MKDSKAHDRGLHWLCNTDRPQLSLYADMFSAGASFSIISGSQYMPVLVALLQGAHAGALSQEPEPSTVSEGAEQPGCFGLDDSDLEEWLESSSNASVHALAVPQSPSAVKLLTASVFRGPRTGSSGDACRVVPPSR